MNLITGEEGKRTGLAWSEIIALTKAPVTIPIKITNTAHAWHPADVIHQEFKPDPQMIPTAHSLFSFYDAMQLTR